jgi:hypothetical protein
VSASGLYRKRWPMALLPGQSSRARRSLTIATWSVSLRSKAVNMRPSISGMFITLKYVSLVDWELTNGLRNDSSTDCPSACTVFGAEISRPAKGGPYTKPTFSTPGIARSCSTARS